MRSHLFHMLLYATLVATFFAFLTHRDRRSQLKLGGMLWLGMVGASLILAHLMAPFPG